MGIIKCYIVLDLSNDIPMMDKYTYLQYSYSKQYAYINSVDIELLLISFIAISYHILNKINESSISQFFDY